VLRGVSTTTIYFPSTSRWLGHVVTRWVSHIFPFVLDEPVNPVATPSGGCSKIRGFS
jgi:hypothetical protein